MNAFDLFSRAGLSIDPTAVETLGLTLLHFLWQGAVVAAALALLDVLLSRRRPQLRYAAGCAALIAMLALPIATFVSLNAAALRTVESPSLLAVSATESPRMLSKVTDGVRITSRRLVTTPHAKAHLNPARQTALDWTVLENLRERLSASRLLPWLVALWVAGVALLSLRLLGGWWLVTRLGRSSQNLPLEDWQDAMAALARRMGIARTVKLVRSGLVSVPTAIGWLRPVILLPASTLTGLSPAQIEAILAHELAHIRRHDYLVNLLQSMIETLLFYHPAVWWVSRRIREERELCCDDLAVRTSGDPVTYARALCQLERLRSENPRVALAASGGSLVTRIARLLGASERRHVEAARGLAWALVASVVLIGGAAGGAVRVSHRSPEAPAARIVAAAERMVRSVVLSPVPAPAIVSLPAAELAQEGAAMATEIAETYAEAVAATVAEAYALAAGKIASVPAPAQVPDVPPVPDVPKVASVNPIACETKTPHESAHSEEAQAEADADTDYDSWTVTKAQRSDRFTDEEWERLAQAGVGPSYVNALARGGYKDLSVEQLVTLAQNGVSSNYARTMRRLLGDPSVEDLVNLARHGVSTTYTSKMRRALGKLEVEDLVNLANHGITSEYVASMRELDLGDLNTEDLVRLANAGVTLEWFSSLRWMGYKDVTIDQAIELRNSGVTATYAASLRRLNRNLLSLEELRTLQNQGIDVQYAASMLGLLRKDLTVEQLIQLRQQGVTVQYVAALRALGYAEVSPEDLISLRQQGIDPEYIAAMASAISKRLAPRELILMQQNGVDADFVTQVRDAGFDTRDAGELIRMRQEGIPNRTHLP